MYLGIYTSVPITRYLQSQFQMQRLKSSFSGCSISLLTRSCSMGSLPLRLHLQCGSLFFRLVASHSLSLRLLLLHVLLHGQLTTPAAPSMWQLIPPACHHAQLIIPAVAIPHSAPWAPYHSGCTITHSLSLRLVHFLTPFHGQLTTPAVPL